MIVPLQWDLTFHNDHLERRFVERFNSSLLLPDKAHCVLLVLLMLFGIARSLTLDSHLTAPWILASGSVTVFWLFYYVFHWMAINHLPLPSAPSC